MPLEVKTPVGITLTPFLDMILSTMSGMKAMGSYSQEEANSVHLNMMENCG